LASSSQLESSGLQAVCSRRIDAAVTPEFQTLPATGFELAAGVASRLVDLTGVGLRSSAVMPARAARGHHERHLAEVAGLQLIEDILSLAALPTHEVGVGDEDRARALRATRSTF
jgi:hypothetical protein